MVPAGKSNNYLAVTGAPEYQQHPVSPNEHYHVEAWELLLQHTNLTAPLSAATLEKILHIIRKAVCLTDMAVSSPQLSVSFASNTVYDTPCRWAWVAAASVLYRSRNSQLIPECQLSMPQLSMSLRFESILC
jgi:hypothetical protein